MAATNVTMDTDWGAKGAQLTGQQVQDFIKGELRDLHNKHTSLQQQVTNLNTDMGNANPQLRAVTDGCFVTYHRKSDNFPLAVPYWQWPSIETSGEVADGVLVLIDGQAPIIVSPTEPETTLFWSKNAMGFDTHVGSDYNQACTDFTGKTRTAGIMARAEELFGEDEDEWANYAPAWCYQYDRSYDKGDGTMIGIGATKWWLPSIAELITIWKHKYAINLCLSVIQGASQLAETWYWSSTEYSATGAWYLHLSNGNLGWNAKVSYSGHVRAVAAFH